MTAPHDDQPSRDMDTLNAALRDLRSAERIASLESIIAGLTIRAEQAEYRLQRANAERDRLAAWKASVEQAEPVGMSSGTTEWSFESGQAIASFSVALPSPAYPAPPAGTKLYTRPSPAAAPERAQPCRTCGPDGCPRPRELTEG